MLKLVKALVLLNFHTHLQHLDDHYKNPNNDIRKEFKTLMQTKIQKVSQEFASATTFNQKNEIIHDWNNFTIKTILKRPDNIGIPYHDYTKTFYTR
jgi:hypothetical protein